MSGSEWFLFPLRVSGLGGLWCGASCVALWNSGYKGHLQQAFSLKHVRMFSCWGQTPVL